MNVESPEIRIYNYESWGEEENKASILRAAGICRRTEPKDFDNFIRKYIIKPKRLYDKHLKLLEHSYIEFVLYNKESVYTVNNGNWRAVVEIFQPVGYNKKIDIRNSRDVFSSILALSMGDCDYVNFYGSLRDILEWSSILNLEDILIEYGLESLVDFFIINHNNSIKTAISSFGLIPVKNPQNNIYQIIIKSNRFTAMQLRTHQSISWLVESTRAVNYLKPGEFSVCTTEDFGFIKQVFSKMGLLMFAFLKIFNKNEKKESGQRFLTGYRTNNMIGFAHKDKWEEIYLKRNVMSAQKDIRNIAIAIGNEINDCRINDV